MDADSESVLQEFPLSTDLGSMNDNSAVILSGLPVGCVLCHRSLSSNNSSADPEGINMCGDCKFLLLEDLGSPVEVSDRRRAARIRRRYMSSESIESHFSQQLLHMINLARQNQPSVSEHENHAADGDGASRLVQYRSSRTTPSGSRRWRRVLSDTESDGIDSYYGESESNVSFGGYRVFPGDSDTISLSAYGGDSDASVDGHSFLDNELLVHLDGGSYIESDTDSDTDIDPMHAGLDHWYSDNQEEDNEEEDNEWEGGEAEESTLIARLERPSSSNESVDGRRQLHSAEFEGTVRLRIRERRQTLRNILPNFEESGHPYDENFGDYLDARGLEELLEHFVDTDNSRRGPPPAAIGFVNSLPRVIITEEQDNLICAICKDIITVDTVVNELPCLHLYHPSCILPWLSARNSCPLCRYELPTDDKDYEDRKRSTGSQLGIHEIQHQDMNEDSSLDNDSEDGMSTEDRTEETQMVIVDNAIGGRSGGRGRWLFFAAAAPILGLVGIALVMWLGKPLGERRGAFGRCVRGQQHSNHRIASHHSTQSQTENNRRRRWWSLF